MGTSSMEIADSGQKYEEDVTGNEDAGQGENVSFVAFCRLL